MSDQQQSVYDIIPDISKIRDMININTTPLTSEDVQIINQQLARSYRTVQTALIDVMREYEPAYEQYYDMKRKLILNVRKKPIQIGEWKNYEDQPTKDGKTKFICTNAEQDNAMVMIWMKELIRQGEIADKHSLERKIERLREAKNLIENISQRVESIHNAMALKVREQNMGNRTAGGY